jgi:hypothetical protein
VTAVGIAFGVGLLLLAVVLFPASHAHVTRDAPERIRAISVPGPSRSWSAPTSRATSYRRVSSVTTASHRLPVTLCQSMKPATTYSPPPPESIRSAIGGSSEQETRQQ